jgi:hypothetical protein
MRVSERRWLIIRYFQLGLGLLLRSRLRVSRLVLRQEAKSFKSYAACSATRVRRLWRPC